jgi:hypothetical protein
MSETEAPDALVQRKEPREPGDIIGVGTMSRRKIRMRTT